MDDSDVKENSIVEFHNLLYSLGVEIIPDNVQIAQRAAKAQADYKRAGGKRDILIPDFLIGANAELVSGKLPTTNPRDFMKYFPGVEIIGYDPAISTKRKNITTANGVIEVPLVKVKETSIGHLSVKDTYVICHDIPELIRVDGLLELNLIENFRVCIDYRKGILEIED